MSRTIVIGTESNLIKEVVSKLELSFRDLSNQIVVFPGKRPAHFLRKEIGEAVGRNFIPPRIFSINTYIDFLCRTEFGRERRWLTELDALALLYTIHQKLNYVLGNGQFNSLDKFCALGMKLFGELEELKLAGLPLESIQSAIEGLPYGRLQPLSVYYEQFYAEVERRQYTTRAAEYVAVANAIDSLDVSKFQVIVLAGFFALTSVENRIFQSLRSRENVTFIFQHLGKNADPWRWIENPNYEKAGLGNTAPSSPKITFMRAPDVHGEVFSLSQTIQEQLKQNKNIDRNTVIVIPQSDSLFPVIHHVLPVLPTDDYNIALGYPLSRSPLFGFIQNLMSVAASLEGDNYPAILYIHFVLHPYTKNIRFKQRADVSRILFHRIEKFLIENKTQSRVHLKDLEERKELFVDVHSTISSDKYVISVEELQEHLRVIHDQTLKKLRFTNSETTIGEVASKLIEVVLYIHDSSTARLHPFFHQYAEHMIETLDGIRASVLAGLRFQEPSGYVNFLKSYIDTIDVPFSGTPLNGLQILGLLETRNLQFETVHVLDVNEGILPGSPGQDMLLPQKLRKKLGLETYQDRERLTEHYFHILIQSAKNVCLYFSESRNGQKERSRFIHRLIWQSEKLVGKESGEEFIRNVRYGIRLAVSKPKPIEKSSHVIKLLSTLQFNATKLDTYLKCPLQFYYRYVLRLSEKEELTEEVDAPDIGILVHKILHALFMPFVGKRLDVDSMGKINVREVIDEQFRKYFGKNTQGQTYLLREQIQERILSFIENYQIPIASEVNPIILGVEETLQVSKRNRVFEARFDRIEQRNEKIFILDYKISGSDNYYKVKFKNLDVKDRSSWVQAIGSFQLPLYSMVYRTFRNLKISDIKALYILLGTRFIDAKIESYLYDDLKNEELYQKEIEEIIFALIDEIQDPVINFKPTDNLTTHCSRCVFKSLCGTQWVQNQ